MTTPDATPPHGSWIVFVCIDFVDRNCGLILWFWYGNPLLYTTMFYTSIRFCVLLKILFVGLVLYSIVCIMSAVPLELESRMEMKSSKEIHVFNVGGKYFFRTVTYHLTGKVIIIDGDFLILEEAAWIPDSGRFSQAINDGVLAEVEPIDVRVMLNINSITDAFVWNHPLPRQQK